jgi:hypothetical protein
VEGVSGVTDVRTLESLRDDWLGALKVAQQEAQSAANAWCSLSNTAICSPNAPACDVCQGALDRFNARLQRVADVVAAATDFIEAWDHQVGTPPSVSMNVRRAINELRAATSPEGRTRL